MLNKFRFLREMLEQMGVPVINDEIMAIAEAYFKEIESAQNKQAE